ncbi:MAG: type I glyceraldehyde-3-phosphate dehydrogenase [Deltaproteobacteria bacterium]|jgi:glyceraldehyde 3-phosphate dehydrogenase|nr:type I glyceraldehyde-3-phosphate dehydrogenase [Deltaproteobacteria bacterium]
MIKRIAINGLGRIGRMLLRVLAARKELEIVAINDIAEAPALAHLLRYDSVHGPAPFEVRAEGDRLFAGQRAIQVLQFATPSELPWQELGVELVIEATGRFTARDKVLGHLRAGARKVVVSAPAAGADITICIGVNEERYDPARQQVISNASCTTNCLAPVAKVLDESFGIVHGLMTTVHAYTGDQRLVDAPHKDLRRARAAGLSMVPTSTGAARAIGLVLPQLEGKLDGLSVRVPVANVSLIDLTALVGKTADATQVNGAMKRAAQGPLKGILRYCEEPLVSADFNGDSHSSIFDAPLTKVIGERLVKVFAWYDNEWGYACRLADLTAYVAARS